MTIEKFQKTILDWWRDPRTRASSVRGMLPWRNTRDPYKILVSEIMLQQTQVTRVIPKYEEFLQAFPTLQALAQAPDKKLLKVWAGLGYWRRAKYLKEAAKIILTKYKGKFPKDPNTLETLPGIGPYTTRAVACFAFNASDPFLDTNIRRVYLHFFFKKKNNVSDKEILAIAREVTTNLCHGKKLKYPGITPREWHYALFDYGATVLKDRAINKRSKHYHKQSKFEGSFRSFRTKAVRFLLARPESKVAPKTLEDFLKKELRKQKSPYTPQEIIASLLKDNLIKKSKTHYIL